MDEEQEKWRKQYTANITGTKEILRIGCAIILWQFIGVALALGIAIPSKNGIIASAIVAVFTLSIFTFPFLLRWRPAYSLIRLIMGNKNLPVEPMPHSATKLPRQPRPWWSYLPGIWFWLIGLLLLYLVIKYFTK